jgi:hypothetical protein
VASLFDSGLTPDEAVSVLTTEAIDLAAGKWTVDSVRLGHAITCILEDRSRLLAVATQAREVRTRQRAYFKGRDDAALQSSKEAERRLDKMLSQES